MISEQLAITIVHHCAHIIKKKHLLPDSAKHSQSNSLQ